MKPGDVSSLICFYLRIVANVDLELKKIDCLLIATAADNLTYLHYLKAVQFGSFFADLALSSL